MYDDKTVPLNITKQNKMAFISKQAFCKGIVLDTINKQNTWRERTYAFMLELQPTFIAISASKARAIAVTPEARRSNRYTDSTVLYRFIFIK